MKPLLPLTIVAGAAVFGFWAGQTLEAALGTGLVGFVLGIWALAYLARN